MHEPLMGAPSEERLSKVKPAGLACMCTGWGFQDFLGWPRKFVLHISGSTP